jgi:GPH family glycoside/pentoside/hexuronide:cation symporter
MSLARRVAYACGNAGFQIPDAIVISVAVYFYLPPEDSDLVPLVSEEVMLGVLTAYGLARLLGGIVDSLADPFVGWGSDRSRSRLGRRRSFLIAGIGPMVLTPVLLFWPVGAPGSAASWWGLTLLLSLYYVFFTVYVGPYLALIPELAPETEERVRLSSLLAAVALPVLGFYPALWLAGVGFGRSFGLDTTDAIRAVVVISSLVAFALCLAPILAVDEKRFTRTVASPLSLGDAVGQTLRNRPFVIYLGGQILFILGITMMRPALPYLSVVALGRDEAFGAWLALSYLPGVVVGFLAMGRLADRFGPKRVVIACLLGLAACLLALIGLRPAEPGSAGDTRNLVLAFAALGLAGPSIAGFMVLPHVMIGQLIDVDSLQTGGNRSAMYYGVQGLLTKWVYAASVAVLSLLLARYGNSREAPLGVLLIAPVGGVCCLLSAAVYLAYPERRILAAAMQGSRKGA